MRSSYRHCLALIVPAALGGLTVDVAISRCDVLPDKATGKLRISVASVSATTASHLQTTVRWEGHEYDVVTGIEMTMNVMRRAGESSHRRELALIQLAMLRTQLNGRPCLDELATMYDNANTLQKQLILTCFLGSRDPRAIPVFVHALEKEQNMKLRMVAASGLAGWNVRRGVAELVQLLDSDREMPQPSQLFYVRDNAMRAFRLTNIRKGWGFPDDKESAEWPPDVAPPPDGAGGLKQQPTVEEIRKWWSENKHRFPDWQPGDPLPEVGSKQEGEARTKGE